MEMKEFCRLIKAMRHNQKRWEIFHTPQIRKTKEELEAEVDAEVNKVLDTQQTIF